MKQNGPEPRLTNGDRGRELRMLCSDTHTAGVGRAGDAERVQGCPASRRRRRRLPHVAVFLAPNVDASALNIVMIRVPKNPSTEVRIGTNMETFYDSPAVGDRRPVSN